MTAAVPRAADALRRRLTEGGAAGFCSELVRVASLPGAEEAAVRRVVAEMQALRLDDVRVDRCGNAIGLVRSEHAQRRERPLVLISHVDHVDVGDASAWSGDPFSGELRDGRIHGRGASDAKGCVAAQVHAAGLLRVLRDEGAARLRHDVVVAAVVQEEVGGLGAAGLVEDGMRPVGAVVGEPSEGHLAFGHRGRVELEVAFLGRAGHASRPDLARNPHASAARFVLALPELAHAQAPRLGRSTVAPTLVRASPPSVNVIPDEVRLTLDWRNVASESPAALCEQVTSLAVRCCEDGITVRAAVPTVPTRSWTGVARDLERVSHPFGTDPGGDVFRHALTTLASGLGRDVDAIPWDFASDGGRLHAVGAACVGYGPGDRALMHVRDESVSAALVEEAVAGNVLLLLSLDETLSRGDA